MKILHLEDDLRDVELVHALLREEWPACEFTTVCERESFQSALRHGGHDLILSDFKLPAFSGLEALQIACTESPDTPFIFVSGTIGEDRAIEAVQAGAADYVLKDRMKRLATAIKRALRENYERRIRRETEAVLHEQAEYINKARDAIVATDLDGHITFWNEGAEHLSGWPRTEIVGRRMDELLAVGQDARVADIRKLVSETGAWAGEAKISAKDGRILTLDLRVTLLRDAAGKPTGRLNIGTDITEKKKLQEQFLRAQRLESIGMLASGIAHDLNNVLTPILMAAPMLRRHATDPLDLRLLETLEHSAERGASLVRQILSFAHGTAGEPRLLQVKHLARDIIEFIEETFPKSITLEQEFPNELWPILANPTQIHQVMLNLCVNARDAMPAGGTLSLRASNRRLDEAEATVIPGGRPGAFVLIEIHDNGTGIPAGVLTHIWEPFFTTKGEGKGTGLGLSTVRGIVEDHQGFIMLQTGAGSGTTFRVYLPAAEADGVTDDSAHPFLPRGNGELILLVDDEANNRDVAHATLARYGYRVLVAGNGTEAIALFVPRSDEIRLVISDFSMPNLDGGALTRILQRLKPGLAILAISGLATKAEGFTGDFLAKPFTTEALLVRVQKLLHSAAPPA